MFNKYKSLLLILIVTFSLSGLAGWITRINIYPWYANLNKALLSPPNWVFGPVWTLLYIFMSVAIWIIYEKSKSENVCFSKKILRIYFYHLIINFSWSFVFFYYHLIFVAFINILFLIIAICILMFLYYPRSKISFYLMTPYFLWVVFAAFLNFEIFLIN